MGRPTDYMPEYNEQARKLCLLGATDVELADFFEVSKTTINSWKKKYPEFLASVKKGKLFADAEVASRLYDKALGFVHEYEETEEEEGNTVVTKKQRYSPPDTGAAIWWLKNRRNENWKDKQENHHSGGVEVTKIVREIVDPKNTDS